MATITLTSNGPGNPSITIEAPDYPDHPGEESRQSVERTWNGGFDIAMPAGSQLDEAPVLRFVDYPGADKTSLRDFIVDDLNFSEHAFTYQDHNAVNHTNMRYISGLNSFQSLEATADLWRGQINLEKDHTL